MHRRGHRSSSSTTTTSNGDSRTTSAADRQLTAGARSTACGTNYPTPLLDSRYQRRPYRWPQPIPSVLDDLLAVADDAVLVAESSIITATRMLLDQAGLVIEPSAALGIAAILENPNRFSGDISPRSRAAATSTPGRTRQWIGNCS